MSGSGTPKVPDRTDPLDVWVAYVRWLGFDVPEHATVERLAEVVDDYEVGNGYM